MKLTRESRHAKVLNERALADGVKKGDVARAWEDTEEMSVPLLSGLLEADLGDSGLVPLKLQLWL